MADELDEQLGELKQLLQDAIDAENIRPPDITTSEESAGEAINDKVHGIIISTDPPSLSPFDAGQITQSVYYETRLAFLQDFHTRASEAHDEEVYNSPSDHEYIGERLWVIWNSRSEFFALYP